MQYEFDLAISFAGSERDYARTIAEILINNELKVFLDELYEAKLWGKNLIESLCDIYEYKAKYCLIIVSKEYCDRIYTNIERRAALDRAIETKEEYILPVIIDNSWIKGLPKSTAYIDLRKKSCVSICELVIDKIKGTQSDKLKIPEDIRIIRNAIGNLTSDELKKYLLEICEQSMKSGVVSFGTIIYDESTVEIKKLLKDEDYWDALDYASGPHFEIFAIKDEEDYQVEFTQDIQFITTSSMPRSRSRRSYFSKVLKEYFNEENTRLAYPSFLYFLVENGEVTKCRLIPFKRASIEEMFRNFQKLFMSISQTINEWKKMEGISAINLWEMLKERLLEENYTLYIQHPPKDAYKAVEGISNYIE